MSDRKLPNIPNTGIVSGYANGVGQNIVANICTTLVGGVCLQFGLTKSKSFDDWADWPIWLVVAGLLILVTFGGRSIYLSVSRWRKHAAVRSGSGDRIALMIAAIAGDTNGNIREIIRETIKRDLGQAVEILVWPESLIVAEGHDADAEALAEATAQEWLKKKKCDILLWGRAKSNDVVSLRTTVAKSGSTSPESHRLTDLLDLPLSALSSLGAAISARVAALAAPAVDDRGRYLVPAMKDVATQIEPLLANMNEAFSSDTRGALFFNYALVRSTIGLQAGNNDDLAKAIAAFREALKEFTRERVPLKWAMTQNNLGGALYGLGERESGTAKLEEAVAVCREALKEFTRERVPLQWAGTQTNFGNALCALGNRESGTVKLEEAVAVYREALKEWTREHAPLQWAVTQNNLGNALCALGERESGMAKLEEAVAVYREALKELTRQAAPHWHDMAELNLSRCLALLEQRRKT